MSNPADRSSGDTSPAEEVTHPAPACMAQGTSNAPVTFDQRGTFAPARTAIVEITNPAPNYGAQGTFNAPVTIYQPGTPPAPATPASTAQERRNRARMLVKVRDFWVAGV